MKFKTKKSITLKLSEVPASRSFSGRKEEGYTETLPENMHKTTRKPNGYSQLAFFHAVKDFLGDNIKGVIYSKSKKDSFRLELTPGSAEHIRTQAYMTYMKVAGKDRNKYEINLESV